MGTYTTNYNLYMPTVGEQSWGTLVNGNFSTIDTTMAGLNTRLTAVESEVNGNLSCTSVTTSGTITATGIINANGGLNLSGDFSSNGNGEFNGTVTANGFNILDGNVVKYCNVDTISTSYIYATSATVGLGTAPSTVPTTTVWENDYVYNIDARRCPQTLKKWGVKRQPTEFRSKFKNLWATQTQE